MGKKSTPPSPDYSALATQQAAASKELVAQQTAANRVNANTPWGSQTWQQNGDQWTQNINLSPEQQAALDSQQNVTLGRSQAAQGLLGQATSSFQSPMDYSGVAEGSGRMEPQQAQSSFDPTRGVQSGINYSGPIQSRVNPAGQIQTGLGNTGQIQSGLGDAGQIQSGVNQSGNIQTGLGYFGRVQSGFGPAGQVQTSLGGSPNDWRQQGQDAALAFMKPQQEQRQAALETQLANQGLTRGSQAWNTEMQRNSDQTTRDQLQAFGAGQSESAQLFGQNQAQGQFANQAQGQQYSQALGRGDFANQAQAQRFSQGLAGGQFANQAQNQQQNLAFNQGQFANQAQGQQFGQNQAQGQFANTAQNQQFNQAVAGGQFVNTAQNQQHAQNSADMQAANQAQSQLFGQNQTQAQFANEAQAQEYAQNQSTGQFANQAASQNNAANLQAGNFNQQLRQQQIAEMQQQRNQPLNELNALQSGQQIQNPNMPSFNQAGLAQTPQILNAANMGYQSQMDAYNARQAQNTGLMNGVTGLAGATAPYWGPALMAMSDRRLKENIKPLFSLGGEDNIKLYSFNFKGTNEKKTGVIAQEVQKVRPDAVMKDPQTGYLKVDYNKVFQ